MKARECRSWLRRSVVPCHTSLVTLSIRHSLAVELLPPHQLWLSSHVRARCFSMMRKDRLWTESSQEEEEEQDNEEEEEWEPIQITVPRERLQLSFSRSSGAGGQNVNKVNTKVRLCLSPSVPYLSHIKAHRWRCGLQWQRLTGSPTE